MKHLFTFLLVAISATSFAQGNLQINQVGSISVSGNASPFTTYTQGFTVPAGKVWKIELGSLISIDAGLKRPRTTGYVALFIDNYWIQGNYVSELESNALPLWIPEGSHILEMANQSSSTYGQMIGTVNYIEFNVVP